MSCQSKNKSVSRLAAARSGVSALAGKAAGLYGKAAGIAREYSQIVNRAIDARNNALGSRLAGVNRRILAAAGEPAARVSRSGAPALGAAIATVGMMPGGQAAAVALGMAANAGAAVHAVSGLAVPAMFDRLKVQKKLSATAKNWQGRPLKLTAEFAAAPLVSHTLNLQDRLVVSPKNVVSSTGALLRVRAGAGGPGAVWHRGSSVVNTSAGKRTITHLRSMQWPAKSYYFDRNLTGRETLAVAAGQVDPAQLRGFVGRITPEEALTPLWGRSKRSMILQQLHWGRG